MKRLIPLLICWPILMGASIGSRSFDGTNDNISMGNKLNVTTNSFSSCMWVKMTEDASADRLFGKRNSDTAPSAGYSLRQSTSDLFTGRVDDATNLAAGNGTTDADAVWTSECMLWDASAKTAAVYVNAALDGTTETNLSEGSLSNAVNFVIGEDAAGGNDAAMLASYTSVWLSKVLTSVEMSEFQYNPEIVMTPNAFFPFWGASTEQDLSGNGVTGTVTGASTSTDGPPVSFGMMLPL